MWSGFLNLNVAVVPVRHRVKAASMQTTTAPRPGAIRNKGSPIALCRIQSPRVPAPSAEGAGATLPDNGNGQSIGEPP